MRIYFRFLRRVVFRAVAPRVSLVARARHRASGRETVLALSTPDGFEAGGVAIAATALALARGDRPRACFVVDELVPLRRLCGPCGSACARSLRHCRST